MIRRNDDADAQLDRDLAELKLLEIAKSYRELLDDDRRSRAQRIHNRPSA